MHDHPKSKPSLSTTMCHLHPGTFFRYQDPTARPRGLDSLIINNAHTWLCVASSLDPYLLT